MKKTSLFFLLIIFAIASNAVALETSTRSTNKKSPITWEVVSQDGYHYLRTKEGPFIEKNGGETAGRRAVRVLIRLALLQATTVPKDGEWKGVVTAAISFNGGWAYICLEKSQVNNQPVLWGKIVEWVNEQ